MLFEVTNPPALTKGVECGELNYTKSIFCVEFIYVRLLWSYIFAIGCCWKCGVESKWSGVFPSPNVHTLQLWGLSNIVQQKVSVASFQVMVNIFRWLILINFSVRSSNEEMIFIYKGEAINILATTQYFNVYANVKGWMIFNV